MDCPICSQAIWYEQTKKKMAKKVIKIIDKWTPNSITTKRREIFCKNVTKYAVRLV